MTTAVTEKLGIVVRDAMVRIDRVAKLADPVLDRTSYSAEIGTPDGRWWRIRLEPVR